MTKHSNYEPIRTIFIQTTTSHNHNFHCFDNNSKSNITLIKSFCIACRPDSPGSYNHQSDFRKWKWRQRNCKNFIFFGFKKITYDFCTNLLAGIRTLAWHQCTCNIFGTLMAPSISYSTFPGSFSNLYLIQHLLKILHHFSMRK